MSRRRSGWKNWRYRFGAFTRQRKSIKDDERGSQCGDVFVFVNAARNRMKILHREESGLVLYALRIEMGRMRLSFSDDTEGLSTMLVHADLISTTKSAMESSYIRRMRMLSSCL